MDLYLYERDLVKPTLIDEYNSLIWTDRYTDAGDFELVLPQHPSIRTSIERNQYILRENSNRVMQIEDVELVHMKKSDQTMLKVTGTSIETFLKNRTSMRFGYDESYLRTGTVGSILAFHIDRFAINPTNPLDRVPNLFMGPYDTGGVSEELEIDRGPVFETIKSLCESEDLGFKIVKDGTRLVMHIYRGKTGKKMFSEDTETIINTKSRSSTKDFRNHCIVYGARTTENVYAPSAGPGVSGWDRRTMYVDATTVGDGQEGSVKQWERNTLRRIGRRELAKLENRRVVMVDGDIPPNLWDDTNLELGTIVTIKDLSGVVGKMRVSEHIVSVNRTGTRHIPTFVQLE